MEWQIWSHTISNPEQRDIAGKIWQDYGYSRFNKIPISESIIDHKITYSKNPQPRGPYYAYNDKYLEIRGGMMEERRGLISLMSLTWLFLGGGMIHTSLWMIYRYFYESPKLDIWFYIAIVFCFVAGAFFLGVFALGGYKISRLEIFTHRHLRVRFNRVTRQVYIQRPKFCGGVTVYRWEDTNPNFSKNGKSTLGTGSRNLLSWEPINTGLPYVDYMAIGKQASYGPELRGEWEFIRRYMEEGPENLPKPRITSLLPLPWHGVSVQLEAMHAFFLPLSGYSLITLPIGFLAITLMSSLYFLSELLCWQPRWPKVIREAGEAGKPIPKLTSLDDFPADIQQKMLLNREEIEYVDDTAPKVIRSNPRKFYKKKKKED
ncbi:DUF6708 domain-containing protein [Pragia fontium]|uniref:DUF6708 domain-containing protein n=1 Tax=Pragia fontium TaxID=82985 RepID=UPI00069A4A8B|nr:DUF6708 domain-containing protein [Pragia fontium]